MSWLLDREILRELPKEWGSVVPTAAFVEEAERLVKAAGDRGLVLRVMGGLGTLMHCGGISDLAKKLKRVAAKERAEGQEYSDIDLIGYRRQRDEIAKLFKEEGYARRRATLSSAASERQIYYHPKGWFYVDVFYDKLLVANHPLDLRSRLTIDYPTITVSDLLLEKIQMWEAFSEKDLKDCLLLIGAHDIAYGQEEEAVNSDYIAELLSDDWGFWYTATTNLHRIREFLVRVEELGHGAGIAPHTLTSDDRGGIIGKINALLKGIDDKPKSYRWKARSIMGAKKRWYNPVETEKTTGGLGIWEALKPSR
ncbi:MAG: hypothetical protein QW390_00055 [Candidatus Bathyarchaeia archaeon]